ncbi:MAG TPA: fibronectin type III domain-containing protein [Thermodesulfobacteriota bacterium]|nr:fibronectin type III domain-containing protein [Thermodesulfobacteriota bacterium]
MQKFMKFGWGTAFILGLFFSACGGGGSSSSDTAPLPAAEKGSVRFNVEWLGAPLSTSGEAGERPPAELNCGAAGVATVQAKLYAGTALIASGEWPCSAHYGELGDLDAGSNRTLEIFGKDSQGNYSYVGGPVSVTVVANQKYDAGTIAAVPYSVTLLSPARASSQSNCSFSFQWAAQGGTRYQIQIDARNDFASSTPQVTSEKSYSPSELPAGRYYWRVRGDDGLGNLSQWSEAWDVTVVNSVGQPPSAPLSVAATPGDGQVSVGWGNVGCATSYNLYWGKTPGVSKRNGTKIANIPNPYTHVGLANGTAYYYVVTAENNFGEGPESVQVAATPGRAPAPPGSVNATPGDRQVSVSWSAVPGATGYNLYWSTDPGVTKSSGTKIAGVASPFAHTALTNGVTYYYVVTAFSSYGESSESTTVSAAPGIPPPAPTGVVASAGNQQVTMNWNPVTGATRYNLYWGTTPSVNKVSGNLIANVASPFTHTGRTNGTTYYYVVTAVNSYGESGESAQVSAIPGAPPAAPGGVAAAPGNTQVTINWAPVTGATSYNLYFGTSPGVTKNSPNKIPNVTSPFLHTGRTNGTTYYYVVTAVNGYGESGESAQVSATPAPPPSPPTGVTASSGNNRVTISWSSVAGATSYNLYWSTTSGVTKLTGAKIADVTSPYNHNQRTTGTTYYYVVTAVNSIGESADSAQVSARAN